MVNPYSAEHPAPPEKFAGRLSQIEEFDRFLADTIDGNPKNLAILGGWGIGKTSHSSGRSNTVQSKNTVLQRSLSWAIQLIRTSRSLKR
jgi:hypothetical protein